MANINDFKAKLAGGGARANQFKVVMPFPGYAQVGGEIEEMAFLCKGTQLPGIPSFPSPPDFHPCNSSPPLHFVNSRHE